MLKKSKIIIRRAFGSLGPGLISGAADDDPSGIATYSIAGAQFGTKFLWTAFLTWPLMASTQNMCARIGMVTGSGLSSGFKKKFPKFVLILVGIALLAANTLNVAADLSAMSDAAEMVTGFSSHIFVILFAVGITWATVRLRYFQIARVLKWLSLFLFSYIFTAFIVGFHWVDIIKDSLIPSLPKGREAWATLVAILGTTISPYLFFWQPSQEVEEEKAKGKKTVRQRRGATSDELIDRRFDVGLGTFFSNLVMFFIILTAAITLNKHGFQKIESSRQAAEALRPLAGDFAFLLYTLGILGTGLLAIPVLTGSAAYALAETFGWRQGLDLKAKRARAFYSVILLSTVTAVILDFGNINPVQALYWSAVINGLLAPFLLVGILALACDRILMNGQPSSWFSRILVGITTVFMFIAGVAMFVV